ncbi:hypothetical protein AOT14_20430 [Stenotrophomonas acidaminiphila]|uniref:DUF2059 domain-containing protein n=1 Tax=Stenotrophomonas acidaminiphila TaxID=128780 RepID=A0A0S1B0B4_9GAMM|nr:hypothetical protein [Stenotrophomonas acidaminiphila]ALJ28418.1 hypothetical protein AOT14_20430 [Stenotrophomonas acidaminiphila]
MRVAALLICLAWTLNAQAAPASPADMESLLRSMQLDADSDLQKRMHAGKEPLVTFDNATHQQCFDRQVRIMTSDLMRESLSKRLGDEGDRIVAEWARFLETPSGQVFLKSFTGSRQEAEAMMAEMDPEELRKGDAFALSRTGRILIEGLNISPVMDAADFPRFMRKVQEECGVDLQGAQKT